MNDNTITYLEEDEKITEQEKKETPEYINNEFINGLPEWDLEPPYEVIKRSEL